MSDTSAFYGDFGLSEARAIRKRANSSIAMTQAAAMGQRRGNRNLADIQRRYSEGFNPVVAGYNRRGLGGPNVKSGVRTAGLEKYAENLQRDLGRETEGIYDQLETIAFQNATDQDELEDFLSNLRLNKQQQILGSAIDIKQMASY
jgi:hypothetical protein